MAAAISTSLLVGFALGLGTGFGLFHANTLNVAPNLLAAGGPQLMIVEEDACEPCGECNPIVVASTSKPCPNLDALTLEDVPHLKPAIVDKTILWRDDVSFFTADRFNGKFTQFLAVGDNMTVECVDFVKKVVPSSLVDLAGRSLMIELIPFKYEDVSNFIRASVSHELTAAYPSCHLNSLKIAPPTMGKSTIDYTELNAKKSLINDEIAALGKMTTFIKTNRGELELWKTFYDRPERIQEQVFFRPAANDTDLNSYPGRVNAHHGETGR